MNYHKITLLALCISSVFCHGAILKNDYLLEQSYSDQVFIGNTIKSLYNKKDFLTEEKTISYDIGFVEDFNATLEQTLNDFSLPEFSPIFLPKQKGILNFLLNPNRSPIEVTIDYIFLANHLLQEREASNKSFDELLARRVMGKAMLKLGEDVMWNVLNFTFSNRSIVTSISQKPSKGLVILGIVGGFAGYFGSQYYTGGNIEVPEMSFSLSKNTSLGIEFWYVGENFNQKEVKNPFPFLLSINIDM